MKYKINIKSAKNAFLTDEKELFESTKIVDAETLCDAISFAIKETSEDKIKSIYLPLSITIDETK